MHASTVVRVPFCGLPCPPLRIDAGAGGPGVAGGCGVARSAAARVTDPGGPRLGGRPAAFDAAVERAAAILAGARRPHVAGLAWSTIGTARRAVRIARRLGASLGIEDGEAAAAENDAVAIAGLPGATFGAVRARADVVLLWRTDPRAEHPDLLPPRLPAASGGGVRRFVRLGRAGAAEAGDLEALAVLRALALGRAPHLGAARDDLRPGGLPLADLREAASALAAARCAAIVWDAAAVRGPAGAAVAVALAMLARDLDAPDEGGRPRRAVARPLGGGGNVAGAFAAVLSETGHARDLDPGGGADAALLVGARAGAGPAAAGRLVVVGPTLPDGVERPDVFLPSAVPGLTGGGLWMRADGIAIQVPDALPRTAPLEEEILDAILSRLPEGRGARPASAHEAGR